MVAWAKYNWLSVILTGVLIIISLFIPVAYSEGWNKFSIWLCGLILDRIFENTFGMIEDIIILSIGITLTIIIGISSLMLIRIGNNYRRGNIDDKKIGKLIICYGILIITSIIVFMVSLNYYTYHEHFPNGIWDILIPSIGIGGPLGGGIMAVGLGIAFLKSSNVKNKEKEVNFRIFNVF